MSSATGETHTFEDPNGKWWWEYHDSDYGSGPQDSGGPHDSADEAFGASRHIYSPSAHFKHPHGSKGLFGNDLFEHQTPPWGNQKEASMAITKCAVGVHVAHDSGDGQTIYHCPFCGSGQVLARSDRTIECEFCHTAFTVQVQPEFSAFPQTVNGQPMEVPGMPGQVDPMGGAPMDPSAVADDGSMMQPGDPMAADGEAEEENQEGEDEDDPNAAANPFQSALHRTAHGAWLDEENYLYHLAIQNSPDPKATAQRIKASRKQAANDHLPAHLQQDWGNKTVNPMDKPHFCLQQSKKTPSIPWHNTVMKYDNGVPQHQECLGCHKKFPVNTEKDGWNSITAERG